MTRRVADILRKEMHDLTISLANEPDEGRRQLLSEYVSNARHKLTKLYVLLRWATEGDPSIVRRANRALEAFTQNEIRMEDAAIQLRRASVVLYVAVSVVFNLGEVSNTELYSEPLRMMLVPRLTF